ncbi:MAG TPA: V-type ATP synthase subunit E family protein [archaeon]|nr:V-type ATP synthase subunit E family protein [archaeon]
MTLENVRESLLQEAKSEENRLLKDAEKESQKILNEAKEKTKQIKAEAKISAANSVETEKKERISAAKLKANKIVNEARNKLVEKSMEQIWNEFKEMPGGKDYDLFMKKIIKDAEKELGTGAMVSVNQKDLATTKKYSKNIAKKTLDISGGAIISSKDNNVSIDASLEAIFENNREEIRGMIFKELFK